MENKRKQFDQIVDYINGRLDKNERLAIKAQIDNDPVLQKMITVLTAMKNEGDQIEWQKLKKPSHDLIDRLLNDVKKQKSKGNENWGVNIFDSGLLPLPDGVRPAEVDTRRLKFLIGDAQLEISIYPISPKSFELIGQISGVEQIGPLSVELVDKKSRIKSKANEFNLFRITRVPAGIYNLSLIEKQNIIGKINLEL